MKPAGQEWIYGRPHTRKDAKRLPPGMRDDVRRACYSRGLTCNSGGFDKRHSPPRLRCGQTMPRNQLMGHLLAVHLAPEVDAA